MTTVIVSQPMFFPWLGMFEQIRLADIYVHYDDVQFSKGSFANRVQLKTSTGPRWMTVPLADLALGQNIKDVRINNLQRWRSRHKGQFKQAYKDAPFYNDAAAILAKIHETASDSLCEIVITSLMECAEYFGLTKGKSFYYSSKMDIGGSSSQRVLDIVLALGGDIYVTGHGASNYLEHDLFERNGVKVEYMMYRRTPYAQQHGEFNPHVTILDLIANCGPQGKNLISSGTINWKEFLNGQSRI